jgi:hypothetical protein
LAGGDLKFENLTRKCLGICLRIFQAGSSFGEFFVASILFKVWYVGNRLTIIFSFTFAKAVWFSSPIGLRTDTFDSTLYPSHIILDMLQTAQTEFFFKGN